METEECIADFEAGTLYHENRDGCEGLGMMNLRPYPDDGCYYLLMCTGCSNDFLIPSNQVPKVLQLAADHRQEP